jgi:hypothetical protein
MLCRQPLPSISILWALATGVPRSDLLALQWFLNPTGGRTG